MTEVRIFNSTPLEFYGGGEVVAVSIAKGLLAQGFDVSFVADNAPPRVRRVLPEQVRDLTHTLRYEKLPFRDYSVEPFSRLFHRLPRIADLTRNGVNLILLHRPPPQRFLRGIDESGLKVVFLVHGFSIEDRVRSSVVLSAYGILLRTYFRVVAGTINRGSVNFQVLTEQLGNSLAKQGVAQERIFVIPNGLPLDQYSVTPSERFDVLFLGRIERFTKGIDLLARILDRLDPRMPADMTVTIVGSGPDDDHLARRAASKWKSGRIKIRGFVSENEKKQLLSMASVMLITSRAEPFSLAAVEGLGSGMPVVSTPASGPSSIVRRHPDFGKVVEPHAACFVDCILEYYAEWRRNPGDYLRERQIRRAHAQSLFSESEMIAGYARMISQICGRHVTREVGFESAYEQRSK